MLCIFIKVSISIIIMYRKRENVQRDGGYNSVDYYAFRQHVTTTKPKSVIWGIFDPNVTLTPDLLTPKFDAFILAMKSITGESLVKFCEQKPKISC